MSGRPHSPGLKYFPLDVDVFRNSKILDLKEDYRSEGVLFYFQLLANIYSKGNYLLWDRSSKRDFRQAFEYTDAEIKQYIEAILNVDLLNKKLFEQYQILTSESIQERYLYSTKKRERITYVKEFMLIDLIKYKSIPQPVYIVNMQGMELDKFVKAPDQKYNKYKDKLPVEKPKEETKATTPKPKTVIPDGFETYKVTPDHYEDDVFSEEVLSLFGLGGMYDSTDKRLFRHFMTALNNRGELEKFRDQFPSYKKLQDITDKEFLHNFENFIGHQSERFEDGKWSKANWHEKLKAQISKNSKQNGHPKNVESKAEQALSGHDNFVKQFRPNE